MESPLSLFTASLPNPLASTLLETLVTRFHGAFILITQEDKLRGSVVPLAVIEGSSLRKMLKEVPAETLKTHVTMTTYPQASLDDTYLVAATSLSPAETKAVIPTEGEKIVTDAQNALATLDKLCLLTSNTIGQALAPLLGWLKVASERFTDHFTVTRANGWEVVYTSDMNDKRQGLSNRLRGLDEQVVEEANEMVRQFVRDAPITIHEPLPSISDEMASRLVEIYHLILPVSVTLANRYMNALISSPPTVHLLSAWSSLNIKVDPHHKYNMMMPMPDQMTEWLEADPDQSERRLNIKYFTEEKAACFRLSDKSFMTGLRILMAEEQRTVLPIINGKGQADITGDEAFILDVDSMTPMVTSIYPLEQCLQHLRHFVGPVFDQLDLSQTVITGSAIPATVMGRHGGRFGRTVEETIDLHYPHIITVAQGDRKSLANALNGASQRPVKVELDTKTGHGTLTVDQASFDLVIKDGADVDMAVDIRLSPSEFKAVAEAHYEVIKAVYPEALFESEEREKGFIYNIRTSYRTFQIYQASLAHIMTHHVGCVRGYVRGNGDKRNVYLGASAVITAATHTSPNYYYFAGKKSKPLDILAKYDQRGFNAPYLFIRSLLAAYTTKRRHLVRYDMAAVMDDMFNLAALDHYAVGNSPIKATITVDGKPYTSPSLREVTVKTPVSNGKAMLD